MATYFGVMATWVSWMSGNFDLFIIYIIRRFAMVMQLQLKDLTLTDHARNKMIALAGSRYNPDTDTITIVGMR